MDLGCYIFLFITGIVTGIFSGLLGIGGALIIIPILRYIPELIGFHTFPLHLITGITSMQTTFGTAASSFFHRKTGNVNYSLVIYVGTGIALGSLSGAIASKFLSEMVLLWIYASFIATAAVLVLLQKNDDLDPKNHNPIVVAKYKSLIFGFVVGIFAGALGFAGSVVIIPLLNTLFEMPLRVCISSCTHIAFIASLMSFIGKLVTGQIEFVSAAVISVSAIIGAFIGTDLSKKASPLFLKYLLLFLILVTLFRVLCDIFS